MGSARASARPRTSRLGGVPVAFPPPGTVGTRQLALGGAPEGGEGTARWTRPLPDVVHVRDWLTPAEQAALVDDFRLWAEPPAGLRHPRVPTGHLMTVQSVCLGWHWQPYAYSRTADDTDGAPVKPMPVDLVELSRRAVADAGLVPADGRFDPDAAIVNFYGPGAKLGLHQDGEEPSDAPVVTISLGDACIFRMAGVDRRTGPFTDVVFGSGDLIVFGGRNRRIYHGVPKLLDDTAPAGLDLPPGRLSITVRQTGFSPRPDG